MTALPLMAVSLDELQGVWPRIVDRLGSLAAQESWGVLDVGRSLLSGQSQLWATASLSGFIVTYVIAEPWLRILYVWIACNSVFGKAADYVPQLRAIARRHDCATVEFETSRPGFARAIPEATARQIYSIGV